VFFKSHARRGEISQSDRVELLHMGARDKLKEKRISEKFQEHRGQLEAKLLLSPLMPYIQKQHVLTSEENERLKEIEPARRNHELLEIVEKKGPQLLVRFVECLEANPENKGLATLFAPPTASKTLSVMAYYLTFNS
jgi:predicted RNA-binding protein associated with RNAse of E/G family